MERLSQQSCLHRIGSVACSILLATVLSFPSLAWADSDEVTSSDITQNASVAQIATDINDVSQTTNGDALSAAQTATDVTDATDAAQAAHTTADVATHVSASTDLPTGNLSIMHTNDIHGRYKDENGSIGFATLKKMVDTLQPDFLLDAGDTFHGTTFATVSEGSYLARLMQAVGYDEMTPGNHDWSYGAAQPKTFESSFGILASNVLNTNNQSGEYFSSPFLIEDISLDLTQTDSSTSANQADNSTTSEKVRVGVFGVIDESFYSSTRPDNLEGLSFEASVEKANAVAKQLREDKGCDVVIALTHHKNPEAFTEQTKGIDAVIAGHEHVSKTGSVTNAAGDSVPVVEAGCYFQQVGKLDLTLSYDEAAENVASSSSESDESPWDVVGYDETIIDYSQAKTYGADESISALVGTLEAEAMEDLGESIGTSKRDFPYPETTSNAPGGWELVRTEDTPIGHVVTTSYLDRTGADLAFENAGGIRGGITKGQIALSDLLSISPYGNTVATYTLTGAQIREALEHSLETMYHCRAVLSKQMQAAAQGEDPMQYSWPDNSGSVIVCGGANMMIDWNKPEGQRIHSITIVSQGNKPLEADKTYTVAMNSYLPSATDEYPSFAQMKLVTEGDSCLEALQSLVTQNNWESIVDQRSGTIVYGSWPDDEKENEPISSSDPSDLPSDTDSKPSVLAQTGDTATGVLALGCLVTIASLAGIGVSRARARRFLR